MSVNDFLILWVICYGCITACRVLPALVLRGRSLSPRVTEALGYIPPAAFAALVTNDLFSPGMFDAGIWPAAAPLLASAVVVFVAIKTKSMLWCCLVGVVCYALLTMF